MLACSLNFEREDHQTLISHGRMTIGCQVSRSLRYAYLSLDAAQYHREHSFGFTRIAPGQTPAINNRAPFCALHAHRHADEQLPLCIPSFFWTPTAGALFAPRANVSMYPQFFLCAQIGCGFR